MPKFTQGQYEAIAKVISDSKAQIDLANEQAISAFNSMCGVVRAGDLYRHTMGMCAMLAQNNPKFSRSRFLKACGYSVETPNAPLTPPL